MFDPQTNLRRAVFIYACIFIGYGLFQVYRSFDPVSHNPSRNYNWKENNFLFKNVYIEESNTIDSVKGARFTSEICFRNPYGIGIDKIPDVDKLNLLEPSNRHVSWLFGIYYLIITCMWGIVFYNFYKFTRNLHQDHIFTFNHPALLKRTGKLLTQIGFMKFGGIMIIYTIIRYWKDIHPKISYDYDMFIEYAFPIVLGHIIILISMAFTRGHNLEQEQEFTI